MTDFHLMEESLSDIAQSSSSKTLLYPWLAPCWNEVQIFDIFWLLTFSVSSTTSKWFAVPVWIKITSYKFIIIFWSSSFPHDSHFSASTRSDTVAVSIVTSFNFAIMVFLPLSPWFIFDFLAWMQAFSYS